MKKIAIVYSSKYGHTKQYADWLKEDVDADAIDISKFNITQMLAYKLVIFACGVYGDKLSIMDFVKKNVTAIPTQKTMIMAVSWYTNDSKEAAERLINDNYPPEFKGKVRMYVVNSGINKKQISKMDSVKLVAAKLAIEKKDGRSSDDINALGILNGYSDSTSKDNLASIKKGIEEFFDPPKPASKAAPAAKAAPAPAPKPAPAPVPKPAPVSNPAPAPAPKPAPAPVPKPAPVPVSNPAPAPVANPAPAPAPKPAPEPASKPITEVDDLANSVEEAFKHLGAKPVIKTQEPPKTEPEKAVAAPAPAAAEEESTEPVIKFNANGKVVVSSVLEAINSLNNPQQVQKPEPMVVEAVKSNPAAEPKPVAEVKPAAAAEPKPQPAAEVKPVLEPKPQPAAEVKPVLEPKPQPAAEVKPVLEPKPKPAEEVIPESVGDGDYEDDRKANSYMKLFAQKRRDSAEEAPKTERPAASVPVRQAEPAAEKPAPRPSAAPAPIPRPGPSPEADLDLGDFDMGEAAFTSASAPAPVPRAANEAASGELDLDSYDFIGESKPAVSNRVLNAVQALAKAKEDAEREAAQKAAERLEQERAQNGEYGNAEEQGFAMSMSEDDDDGIIVEDSYNSAYEEEESDGLEAFEFTNDFDYDVEAELDIKFVEPESLEAASHESRAELDIKKLQEEINASIESNRAAKERMEARYNRRKEEAHNPFSVQFEEDEDKKKRKNKKAAAEPKFLDDPIDPDIFFAKPNKNMDFNTGSMPEIRFKH